MRVGYEGRGGGLEYRTCVITRGRSSFCDRSEAHFHMYNESFRWLAIFKLFTLGLSYDEVVEHLCVGVSTLKRWAWRYEATGNVVRVKKAGEQAGRSRKLSSKEEVALIRRVLDSPCTTLSDQRAHIILSTGKVVSLATLGRVFHRHGLTRQRVRKTVRTQAQAHPTPASSLRSHSALGIGRERCCERVDDGEGG